MSEIVKNWPVAECELDEIKLVVENAGKKPFTIQQLLDFEQIKATQYKYTYCVDNGVDIADFADVFHPDLVCMTWGHGEKVAPEERREQSREIHKIAGCSSHHAHNPLIYFVDDDTAILLTKLNDRISYISGQKFEGWGWYCNTFVRCPDGQWRIKKLIDSWMGTEGYLPGYEEMFGIEK